MTVPAIIATAAAAFFFGFFLGTLGKGNKREYERRILAEDEEIKKLRQEYSNFLSYDGTEESQR
ncbi:MAG: hypothetical protein UHO61_02125 [Acutalibacteraceae bacterium]|nr:hypothetical protein [Acutalibacteraceae bacterium]